MMKHQENNIHSDQEIDRQGCMILVLASLIGLIIFAAGVWQIARWLWA